MTEAVQGTNIRAGRCRSYNKSEREWAEVGLPCHNLASWRVPLMPPPQTSIDALVPVAGWNVCVEKSACSQAGSCVSPADG